MEAKSAEYDKLVFKTLSKEKISKGEKILAELKEAVMKPSNKQNSAAKSKRVISELTSQYYSHVPHLENEPVILLDNLKIIQKETNMLRSLEGVKMSAILAREINLRDNGHDETLDEHFKALSLKNIDVGMLLADPGHYHAPRAWVAKIYFCSPENRWCS